MRNQEYLPIYPLSEGGKWISGLDTGSCLSGAESMSVGAKCDDMRLPHKPEREIWGFMF